MTDWVRFHRELCVGEKKGVRRAHRFVYMELSREARARRGRIALPKGMGDVEAICDLLGGNRKEVVEALAALTDGIDPMVRFEDEGGKRWLVVVEWAKWNPVDGTAAERQQRKRDEDRKKRDAERDVTRDVYGSDRNESRGVTEPRASALLSSFSASDLDLGEGPRGEGGEERGSSVVPAAPDVRNATADGAMGMLVSSWADGIRSVTGEHFPLPRGTPAADLSALLRRKTADTPDACDAARQLGAQYASTHRHRTLSAMHFGDWIGSGRPAPGSAPRVKAGAIKQHDPVPIWAPGSGLKKTEGGAT